MNVGYSPRYVHHVKIKWTAPIPIDETQLKQRVFDKNCGWYYVTRRWAAGDNLYYETPLYIGKARGVIYKRVLQHNAEDSKCPYLKRKGKKYVRFGIIQNPELSTMKKISQKYHVDRFLKTVESALIMVVQPENNVSQSKSYTRWYKLIIENTGRRSCGDRCEIPPIIDNREHVNVRLGGSKWVGQLEM